MLEEAKKGMKEHLGVTAADFDKHVSYPHNRKIIENHDEIASYRIIAEVVESKYCSAGLKKGGKLVFKAIPTVFVPEESDCPLCLRALGPMASLAAGFWERIYEGLPPNEGMWHISECLDPGVEKGGLGHVIFKVYVKKAEPAPKIAKSQKPATKK